MLKRLLKNEELLMQIDNYILNKNYNKRNVIIDIKVLVLKETSQLCAIINTTEDNIYLQLHPVRNSKWLNITEHLNRIESNELLNIAHYDVANYLKDKKFRVGFIGAVTSRNEKVI